MPTSMSSGSHEGEADQSKTFMKYSYMFVRLYSRLASGQHLVSGTIDPTGTKMLLQVIDRNCNVWEGTYTDSEVLAFKCECNENLSWPNFFELLQRTFAEHLIEYDDQTCKLKLTVKHDRQSESLPLAPFVTNISVKLEPTTLKDFAKTMTETMISFVMLRTGDRKEMDRVVDVIRIDAALKDEVERVQDEVRYIEAGNSRFKGFIEEHDKSYEELAAKLNECPELAGWEEALAQNAATSGPNAVCRVPDPLKTADTAGGYETKLDKDLLSVLKSELSQATYTYAHLYRYNNLVAPFPPEEREAMIGKLKPISSSLYRFLVENVDEWEFNIFEMQDRAMQAGGSALVYLAYFLMWRHNLPAIFNLDETKLVSWLEMVAAGYETPVDGGKVTFHTSMHAADVLHAVYYMCTSNDGIKRMRIKDGQLLALLLAASMHDFQHQAVNNTFYTSAATELGKVYADGAAMEHFHMAQVFELMKLPQYDIFDCTPPDTKEHLERMIIDMILATDMKKHQFYMAAYEAKQGNLDHRHSSDTLMTLCMILKAADVSNCAKDTRTYQRWASAIMKEYSYQSELEGAAQVEKTQTMMTIDSSEEDRAKGQLGFMNHVVLPLFALISEAVPALRGAAGEYLAANKLYWADQVHKTKGTLS